MKVTKVEVQAAGKGPSGSLFAMMEREYERIQEYSGKLSRKYRNQVLNITNLMENLADDLEADNNK